MTINPQDFDGLILDSNLLLLYIVGSVDPVAIKKINRVSSYSSDDLDSINTFVKRFKTLCVSPNILTEITNLLDRNFSYMQLLSNIIEKGLIVENYVPALSVCQSHEFKKFGLTDSICIEFSKQNYFVLTADNDLGYFMLQKNLNGFPYSLFRNLN